MHGERRSSWSERGARQNTPDTRGRTAATWLRTSSDTERTRLHDGVRLRGRTAPSIDLKCVPFIDQATRRRWCNLFSLPHSKPSFPTMSGSARTPAPLLFSFAMKDAH